MLAPIQKTATTISQFILWYLAAHTMYWGIEQMRYTWCVGCGFQGYIHSLMFSQSIVCKILTEASKFIANQQLNNIILISSFVGIKILGMNHHPTKKD